MIKLKLDVKFRDHYDLVFILHNSDWICNLGMGKGIFCGCGHCARYLWAIFHWPLLVLLRRPGKKHTV